MSNTTTDIDGLEATIGALLNDYSDSVILATKNSVKSNAKTCCENIKADSPKKTGKYSRGWRVRIEESPLEIKGIVYNGTCPALTHLLENGHGLRNGGRARAFPHIKKNEQAANENTLKEIEEAVKNV